MRHKPRWISEAGEARPVRAHGRHAGEPWPDGVIAEGSAAETDVCMTAWRWLHFTDVTTWGPGREREGLLQFVLGPQYSYLGYAPAWVRAHYVTVRVSWRLRAESDDSGVI